MNLIDFDLQYINKNFRLLGGIDEVGRGCLFGDVVSACVIMPLDDPIEGVKDSKKLSEKRREVLYEEIMQKAIGVGIGRKDRNTIDKINIRQATRLAMKDAIRNLENKNGKSISADLYLVDAENIDLPVEQKSIIHGDDQSYSIACASIVAKVYRDHLCLDWDKKFPGYDLAKNKGYGTKAHRQAILDKGVTELHRKSFLKKILSNK